MTELNTDALDSVSSWSIGLCSNRVELGLHAASWLLSVEFHCLISACWVLNFDCLTDVNLVKLIAKLTENKQQNGGSKPQAQRHTHTPSNKMGFTLVSLFTNLLL